MKKIYVFILGIVFASAFLYLFISMVSNIQRNIEDRIKEEFNKEQNLVTDRIVIQLKEIFVDGVSRHLLFLKQPFAMKKLLEAMESKNKRDIAFWRDGMKRVFLPFLNSNTIYHYIVYADEEGNEIVKVEKGGVYEESEDVSVHGNISDNPVFAETMKLNDGQIHISKAGDDGHIDIKIGTPVFYKNKKRGVVILEIHMPDIYSSLTPIKLGKTSHAMLFTDKGELIFCSKGLVGEEHKGEIDYILKNPSGGYAEIPESHGEKNILLANSSLNVGNEKWIVAMESTSDEVTGRIREFEQHKSRIITMLILVSIVVLSYFFKTALDKARNERSAKENLEKLNNELNIANKKLIDIDKQKTEFLNIVAHDLRTPLTSIRSYTEMILMHKDKPDMSNKIDNFINAISHEGIRLESLANEYLDIAKIESGTMTFNKGPVDIKMIIKWSIETFRGEAMTKGIKIYFPLTEDIPLVIADDGKIGQVMSNLLSNAVKFTPRGGTITVSAERKGDYVEVYVEDSGPGISKEYHEKIFEKFVQLQHAKEIGMKGIGFGLSIVKFIVEKHGGWVWVESEAGKGAKFLFTLPINPVRSSLHGVN